MSHNSQAGRIDIGFNRAIRHIFARIRLLLFCELAMLLLAAPARAAIAVQDGSTTITETASSTATLPVTVTSGANVLVVLVEDKGANPGSEPATISWNGGTLTRAVQEDLNATTYRGDAIYYCFNPPTGTAVTLSVTVTGATSIDLTAYTLNGVDTTTSPLTGAVDSNGGGDTQSFNVGGVASGSWAAVNATWATTGVTPAVTGTGGTAHTTAATSALGASSSVTAGYISGLSSGTVTFQGVWTGTAQKVNFAAAVFSPVSTSPPTISSQPQGAFVFSGVGATARFSVTAIGPALSYQWYSSSSTTLPLANAVALAGASKYGGTNTSTLSISNVVTGDLTNYAVVITNSFGFITSSIVTLANWPTPALQLRMPFTNSAAGDSSATTTASDTSGGGINITMNMTTNAATPMANNLHGAAGTGVTISNPNAMALDMTTNTTPSMVYTNEPDGAAGAIVSLVGSSTLATLGGGGGNISNFTAMIWAKWNAPFNSGASGVGGAPRLWQLNAGSTTVDTGGANSVGFQFLSTNTLQIGEGGSQVVATLPSGNFPVGEWMFIAMTYDGVNYKIYYGTDTSAAQLILTTAATGNVIPLGSTASLAIGNRFSTYNRGLNGWLEDFRFYNNPGDSNFVENVRASLAPLPIVPVVLTQPTPVSVYPGQTAQFTASVAGTAPITNQWYFGTTQLTDGVQGDGSGISGSGTTTLTITNVTSAEAGNYALTTTNVGGGTNSTAGVLTVLPTGPATNFSLNYGGTPIVEAAGTDWNTVSNWNPGGLSAVVSVYANPGSSFELLTGSLLRTPTTAGLQVFPGVQLTVDGSGVFEDDAASPANVSELRFKNAAGAPTNYFSNLVLNGGQLDQGVGALEVIQGTMTVSNNSSIYVDTLSTQDRGYQIDSWLTGSGDLLWHQWSGGLGGINLQVTGTSNTFSGQWMVDQGALVGVGANSLGTNNILVGINSLTAAVETLYDINNTNASLILGANGEVFLHQNDTFCFMTIAGAVVGAGTYTSSQLTAAYSANFPAAWTAQTGSIFNSASGSIKVLHPATPMASNFVFGVVSGVPQTVQIIGGQYAPTDADGNPLIVSGVSYTGGNGAVVTTDGANVTYTSANTFTGMDSFTYTVSDPYGVTATATVTVYVVNAEGFNLLSAQFVNGDEVLDFAGIPYYQYALDWTTNLTSPVIWVPILTNTAGTDGLLIFTNPPSGGSDFYRTRYVP